MKYDMVKLKELCTVNQGLQIPISKRYKEPGKNRYFYITVQFLKDNGENYYIENPPKNVICTEDEILVVRTGNTGQVITGVSGCFHNNFFKVTPNEKIYPKYLYYALNNKKMHDAMLNAASGTTIPDLKHSSFYDLEIPLPEINIQKKIAKILDNICYKLKLNKEINNNLYDIQKCYFKEIFRKQEYHEMRLDDLFIISAGGDAPKDKQDLPSDEYLYPIVSNGIENEGIYGYSKEYKIDKKSVTISARGTIGYKVLRDYNYYPIVRLISLFPKNDSISAEYLFYALDDVQILGTGTTQQQLTVPMVKDIRIKVYDVNLIKEFTNYSISLNKKINNNKLENRKLSELRDTLLPKLMNGEIDLDSIEF